MQILEITGKFIISFLEYAGQVFSIFMETIKYIFKLKINLKNVIFQIGRLGYDSLAIVLLTVIFSGMVISLELALQAVQFGIQHLVGGGVAIAMAREFSPMLTAVIIAGRVGSAITAEIASMKVTEQIDALKTMQVNPVRYLVVPRMMANIFSIPILEVLAFIAGTWGGMFVARYYANIDTTIYINSISRMLTKGDVIGGFIKAIVFAIIITLISVREGFNTKGGAAGVGISTTNSVVISIILIFVFNFFLSALLF